MKIPKGLSLFSSILMATILTNAPAVAMAESIGTNGMIETAEVVSELSRAQAQRNVENLLSRDDVRKALISHGVSPDEVTSRLASLTDQELRDLSGQMNQARAGGDILVAILLVVLIIFLIKRI